MLTVKPALQGNAALFKQYSTPNATGRLNDWLLSAAAFLVSGSTGDI